MKKKSIATIALTLTLLLAGCGATENEQEETVQEPNTITDMSEPTVMLHEEIVEQEFGEDETVDNPYYKRTVDEDGNPVFEVIRKRDGQKVTLPLDNTVLYVTETGPSYFEQVTITYKENGEEVTMEQYNLYAQSTTEEEPVSPEEHPDITVEESGSGSSEGSGTSGSAGTGSGAASGAAGGSAEG